jgi:hypothetical protein
VTRTPPLSDQNRFSILTVDSIPEIDEPVDAPKVVQTPETPSVKPATSRISKTRVYIPMFLMVSACFQVAGNLQSRNQETWLLFCSYSI